MKKDLLCLLKLNRDRIVSVCVCALVCVRLWVGWGLSAVKCRWDSLRNANGCCHLPTNGVLLSHRLSPPIPHYTTLHAHTRARDAYIPPTGATASGLKTCGADSHWCVYSTGGRSGVREGGSARDGWQGGGGWKEKKEEKEGERTSRDGEERV